MKKPGKKFQTFGENLLACVFGGFAFLAIGYASNLKHQKKPSLPVYDYKLKQFIKRERGLNETVLNSLDSLEYRTREMLDYYQKVEDNEQSSKFTQIKNIYEGGDSKIQTIDTMMENFQLIKTIDNATSVKEEHKSLKELLTKCNKIYDNTREDRIERVISLYNEISKHIKPGEITIDSSVSIVDLVDSKIGDCNDLSPAYFALFNYYHISCYLTWGKVKYGNGTKGLHAWIHVYTLDNFFELDPTWYEPFTPLDTRNKEIKDIFKLKEEDMRYK